MPSSRSPGHTQPRRGSPLPLTSCLALVLLTLLLHGNISAGEIVFVRHGETVANATGKYTDATVNRLTPRGVAQAAAVPERLGTESFTVIVTSPAERCRQTITPYLRAVGARAQVWPELEEVSNRILGRPGKKEPPPRAQLVTVEGEAARHFTVGRKEDAHHLEPRTRGEALAQVDMAVARLLALAKKPEARVLVVGHSLLGSRILEQLLGRPVEGKLVLENGAVNRLTVDARGRATLVQHNDQPVR